MADREKAKEARGVDSVTDYVEEEQVGDEEKAKASLVGLGETNSTVSSSRTK